MNTHKTTPMQFDSNICLLERIATKWHHVYRFLIDGYEVKAVYVLNSKFVTVIHSGLHDLTAYQLGDEPEWIRESI